VVCEGKLWLTGGHLGDRATNSVLIYDPENDSWATGPFLHFAGESHAAVHEGEVHVAIYAIRAGTWRPWRYNGTAWVRTSRDRTAHFGACESIFLG
jgi:hypothetical protein